MEKEGREELISSRRQLREEARSNRRSCTNHILSNFKTGSYPSTTERQMSSKSRHISTFSSASIDLDVEGGVGSSLADDYDFKVGSLWSAKGPAVAVDQNPRVPLGHHLDWARKGWVDANRWPHAARLVLR